MYVDVFAKNPAFVTLINDIYQIFPVDTNLFIAPDRKREAKNLKAIDAVFYQRNFLDVLIKTFPYLAIHEAVYNEFVSSSLQRYVNEKLNAGYLMMLTDSSLTVDEQILRNTFEEKIAFHTQYDLRINNKDDRGEVKSLAYIATKAMLYFCSRDSGALRLIEKAEELDTNLDQVGAIRFYEIVYFLHRVHRGEFMRNLYIYLFYITPLDKKQNPKWQDFLAAMDAMCLKDAVGIYHRAPRAVQNSYDWYRKDSRLLGKDIWEPQVYRMHAVFFVQLLKFEKHFMVYFGASYDQASLKL